MTPPVKPAQAPVVAGARAVTDAGRAARKQPVDQAIRTAATTDLNTCFFLEAGAGTGKTRILVDRVVEIVRRGAARIEQVVVITFTEKAAGELRARVRDRLHERFEHAQEPERSRYRDALRDLVSAHIETIHAFASSLLREFPLEARINPGFRSSTRSRAGSTSRNSGTTGSGTYGERSSPPWSVASASA